MPGHDDGALLSEIRKIPQKRSLPVMLLAPVTLRNAVATAGLSSVAVLTKPVKFAHLQAALLQGISGGNIAPTRRPNAMAKMDGALAGRLPLQILVVDDNIINQKVASRLLQQLGYAADIAKTGIEAIRALEQKAYDVILMDVQMPEMDGLEATRRIRQRRKETTVHPHFQQSIVIIAMTANAMQGDREKCVAAGMDDYITKPVRPEVLQGLLQRHGRTLAKTAGKPSPDTANPANVGEIGPPMNGAVGDLQPSRQSATPVDMNRLFDFAGGDVGHLNELVNLYLKQTTEQIDQIRDALDGNVAPRVASLAHSCAGASATCGMVSLVPLLRQMECCGHDGDLSRAADLISPVQREFERIRRFLSDQPNIKLVDF
jgi:CheY-like chemotaxis protein/HPt (histidine-containing phosphotransfer) domain-containing protein